MNTLHIADGIDLPLEFAARTNAIIAQKGAGKTYAALRLTELLLSHRQQVVAMDPTGVWWGLRAAAPGGRAFDVIVLGGEHADAPLEPAAGAIVAQFAVNSGRSLVLDMSGFESNAAQDRFAADFLESLYRLKATARTTLHLMVDEADSFAPQRPQPGQQRMLGAMEAIVRRGRSRGLGITMISQRPAVLNKNVLSQADLLMALRIVGVHDHTAMKEWASLYGTPDERAAFLAELPKLATGEAYFWSPSWLGIFRRGKVTKRATFDSSRTPEPGDRATAPQLAHVDIATLSDEIRASVERAKANDPKELRAEVARLKRQVAELEAGPKQDEPTRLTLEGLARDLPGCERALHDVWLLFVGMRGLLEKFGYKAGALYPSLPEPSAKLLPKPVAKTAPPRPQGAPRAAGGRNGAEMGKAERAIMTVLAQYAPEAVEKSRIALIAGYAVGGGGFNNALSALRSRAWIQGSDPLALTTAGAEAIGDVPALPTGGELLEYWQRQLGKAEAAVLAALSVVPRNTLTKDALAERAGYAAGGGGFNNALSKLRTLKLIAGRDALTLAEELQP